MKLWHQLPRKGIGDIWLLMISPSPFRNGVPFRSTLDPSPSLHSPWCGLQTPHPTGHPHIHHDKFQQPCGSLSLWGMQGEGEDGIGQGGGEEYQEWESALLQAGSTTRPGTQQHQYGSKHPVSHGNRNEELASRWDQHSPGGASLWAVGPTCWS